MGLDITHYKVTQFPIDASIFILNAELNNVLPSNEIFRNNYKRKKVDGVWDFVALFETQKDLELTTLYLDSINDGYQNYQLRLVASEEGCENLIDQFEKKMGIEGFKKEISEKKALIDNCHIKYRSISYEGTLDCDVIFANEVGYQRKGMNREFYDYFANDSYYADRNSFEKLLAFSDPENHMYNPENIKNNFINKFEEGKSRRMEAGNMFGIKE